MEQGFRRAVEGVGREEACARLSFYFPSPLSQSLITSSHFIDDYRSSGEVGLTFPSSPLSFPRNRLPNFSLFLLFFFSGDINVVATGNDISDAAKGWNKVTSFSPFSSLLSPSLTLSLSPPHVASTQLPGWTRTEVDGYNSQLNPPVESGHKPLVDAWRQIHGPDEVQYSFREFDRDAPLSFHCPSAVWSCR